MGNHLASCAGGRSKRSSGYSFEVAMDPNSEPGHHRQKPSTGDDYEARMQIDDEELAVRYRHCMQTTDRQRRKSSSSVRLRPSRSRVKFRLESFDSQASTESERRNFVMLLIDSLPETFLDEDETSGSSTTVRTTAQVNHYDADEENIEDEGFSGASSSTSPPPSKENAILSESAQSHTYESIKSMEEAAAGEPSHSASSPSPPPPPPPKNKQSKRSKELRRQASVGKAGQANGIKEAELTAS
ncbi:hypothetical protein BOX15_Mlig005081g1 [Macrostomum lignano]|uniref:Uncharacterized protein n=1 Tax=Macrostomum lignano TaxID=282301 RepID=A0A267GX46_9PLAT|nr:hypothetical protein BOX15_Mlig005081g1 [Macrostomum lignano]